MPLDRMPEWEKLPRRATAPVMLAQDRLPGLNGPGLRLTKLALPRRLAIAFDLWLLEREETPSLQLRLLVSGGSLIFYKGSLNDMLERAKKSILILARRAGYEVLKRSDPRLSAENSQEPTGAPDITLDAALNVVRDHAGDERVASRIFDVVLREAVASQHRSMFWGDRLLTLDKSAAFRDDPRFAAAMQAVTSDTGATQYAAPDGISWRLNTLVWAARMALHTPGDFVECGVYKGDMSWVITELVDLAGAKRSFYLYDTFEGFSPKYSSEDDFPLAPQFFNIADRAYNTPELYSSVCDRFSKKPYVKIVKGVVPDILQKISPDKIAFMHIDLNSPAPETGALELFFERVSPGGVVIFDDYGWFLHIKQKEAADNFMSNHDHDILELPTGQGVLIKH